jgi:hypothetical protein
MDHGAYVQSYILSAIICILFRCVKHILLFRHQQTKIYEYIRAEEIFMGNKKIGFLFKKMNETTAGVSLQTVYDMTGHPFYTAARGHPAN